MAERKEHGFTDVDSSADPEQWPAVLDRLRREPFYRDYKARVRKLLDARKGGIVLEVGAGTGDDARAMADHTGASVIALDVSRTMMREAVRRGVPSAVAGCAASLPFPEETFDACWADRTLQHLADPCRAVREMIRVAKAGAPILVVDPDYSTQSMEFPDPALAWKVLLWRTECGLRNGALARRMGGTFTKRGLRDVRVETRRLEVRDASAFDNVLGLRDWAGFAREAGYLGHEEVTRWLELYDEVVGSGRFFWGVTFFLTVGRK